MAVPLAEVPLIATLSVGLGAAFVAGFAAMRLGLPPLVGYLLAGMAIGPFTPGYVADAGIAGELAEIGVILLMFGVGTHFSVRDLWSVRRIALPGALVQIAVATLLGAVLARAWGWSLGGALIFGLSLSVASTVVMLRALQARGLVDSLNGRIAVGWLVVEDLAMVLALVLLPALAGFLGGATGHAPGVGDNLLLTVGWTFLKIGLFFALMYGVGLRVFPWLAAELGRAGSRELVTLFVTVLAISMAYGAAVLFGVSFALGAFLAGVVVNEAGLTQRFAAQAEVLEHVFAVLFFVSVGMLFNPLILVDRPLQVLAVLGIVMVGKTLAAYALVRLFRYPAATALTVSASLAQIGEFSFILAGLGMSLGLLPAAGRDLILAGALLSITLNPLVFRAAEALSRRGAAHTGAAPLDAPIGTVLPPGHVVLVGYGRVGRVIGKLLTKARVPLLVIDQSRDRIEKLRKRGWNAVEGDAGSASLLERCGIRDARVVIVALPNADEARRVFELVRRANPQAEVIVRTHQEEEQAHYREQGADFAPMAEQELGQVIAQRALLKHREQRGGDVLL